MREAPNRASPAAREAGNRKEASARVDGRGLFLSPKAWIFQNSKCKTEQAVIGIFSHSSGIKPFIRHQAQLNGRICQTLKKSQVPKTRKRREGQTLAQGAQVPARLQWAPWVLLGYRRRNRGTGT